MKSTTLQQRVSVLESKVIGLQAAHDARERLRDELTKGMAGRATKITPSFWKRMRAIARKRT